MSLQSNTINIKVTDLDIADYVAILEYLAEALDARTSSNEAKPLGLQVSWTKTRIQDLGVPVQSVHACGFTYLGSVVHDAGLLDQEVSRHIGLAASAVNLINKNLGMPVPVTCLQGPGTASSAFQT